MNLARIKFLNKEISNTSTGKDVNRFNMKTMIRFLVLVVVAMGLGSTVSFAQKTDDERMRRDIEVAENVLSTLIKQQFNNQRTFFPLEIRGSYQPGYGVTFTLPADYTTPIVFSIAEGNSNNSVVVWGDDEGTQSFSYSYSEEEEEEPADRAVKAGTNTYRLKDKNTERKRMDMDSIRNAYNQKVIDASKTFLLDYGDMLTQLTTTERIVISNQGNQPRAWVNQYFNAPKRTHLSVEILKGDLAQYKQGKISKEQAQAKMKVVNTETVDNVQPDLELLSSIFNRLYSPDLSKTFFTEENLYYESLKDYGVIFYMQVYSSAPIGYQHFAMPTLRLDDVDLATRNKKVTELYPKFEQELKENILEYGRTLKSLKDEELLVFQVKITKCEQCGIPSSLDVTIKASVLKDLSNGKIDKNAALSKLVIKKGPNQ